MYEAKLEVMNLIAERTNNDERKFELVQDQNKVLLQLYTYLPNLMNYLWEKPKIVSFIIQNSKINLVKEYLAPLFANNFYNNILSSNYVEDNLIYVLTLSLDNEINNLFNIKQFEKFFLDDSPCSYLLEELRKKNDIQTFFKTIIFNSVKNLEINSSLKLNFNTEDLLDDFKKREAMNKNLRILYETASKKNKKIKEEQEIFKKKYCPMLDKKALEQIINENKNSTKMNEFLNEKLKDLDSSPEIYSNSVLMTNLYGSNYLVQLLLIYEKYFSSVTEFIDNIFENILNNLHLLPYSVKCLCKIISLLIKKKFPLISEVEQNLFIAKFFFGKLLIPILKNPGIEVFINEFIISQNTLNNLKVINSIIHKFISGHFYKSSNESNYTPFNWYFIEKMEQLLQIFDNITKVRLPTFIEKYINGELPEDYEYNYFKENPEEVVCHRSILFNLHQAKVLISVMDKFKAEIFTNEKSSGLKKTIEKLMHPANQEVLNNILKNEIKPINEDLKSLDSEKSKKSKKSNKSGNSNDFTVIEKAKPKLNFFLISSLIYNEKYNKLFNINQESSCYCIKELKSIPDEESRTKNDIIRVKNFFCCLLYGCNKLVQTDFEESKLVDTENILIQLKKFIKPSNFINDGSIPSDWYITSLLDYLKKIPEYLTKNDCEELYQEIKDELNKSIKELDFEVLSIMIGKLRFAKFGTINFEANKKSLIDIKLNEESKLIIETEIIPIDLAFSFDENTLNGSFEIKPSSFKHVKDKKNNKEKIKEYEKKKRKENIQLCLTINQFIKKFPNLIIYQELQDVDIFEIQKNLEFSNNINNYIKIISESINEEHRNGFNLIIQKIYDYIMSKIYDKIFPIEPYEEDNKLFQQSIRLAWTESKHFINTKRKLIYGSYLNDALKYFNLIDSEKSPRKKILNMMEIYNSIGYLLQLNGIGKEAGVDEEMPILNYTFVKAQPTRIYSNAKFMEIYIGERKSQNEGSKLAQLLSICSYVSNLDYSQLLDVTEEEFNKRCNESTLH